MVKLTIHDSTTVDLGPVNVDGPGVFHVDSVTVGAETFTHGSVVVVGGTAYQLSRFTAEEMSVLPLFLVVPFLAAFIWAKL